MSVYLFALAITDFVSTNITQVRLDFKKKYISTFCQNKYISSSHFNPKQAGGSGYSLGAWGEGVWRPPQEKGLRE